MGPRGQALSLRRGELPWPREQWLFLCLAWPGLRVLVFVMAGFVLSEVQCVDSLGLLKMVQARRHPVSIHVIDSFILLPSPRFHHARTDSSE